MVICPKIKRATYFIHAPCQPSIHVCVTTNCQLFVYKAVLRPQCTAQLATGAGSVQKCAILPVVGADQGSCSYHKRTIPEFICNRTEIISSNRSWSSCFGPQPSSITAFTLTQMNRTKRENECKFNSNELNKAGVKTSLKLSW